MITHLGRVVYDRAKHDFKTGHVSRIIWAQIRDLEPAGRGLWVAQLLIEIMRRWIRDPRGLKRFLQTLLDEIVDFAGTVQIVPDWRLTTEKRFRGLPSEAPMDDNGIEGGPENGQSEGPVQQ